MSNAHGPPDPIIVLNENDSVTSLAFNESPGKQTTLLSGHMSGKILEWCLKRQRTVESFTAHSTSVLWIAVYHHPQYDVLFSQGRDGHIKVWTNKEKKEWSVIGYIPCSALTFCNSTYCELNAQLLLSTTTENAAEVNVYRLPTEDPTSWFSNPDGLKHQTLRPEPSQNYGMCMKLKSFMNKAQQPRLLVGYESGTVVLWDSMKSQLLSELKLFSDPVMCLAVEPKLHTTTKDKKDIFRGISGSTSAELISWHVDENDCLLKDHSVTVTNAGFNDAVVRQDGKIVVTAGWDHNVRVFALAKLKPLAVLSYHRQSVQCVQFSSDRLLAAGGKDGQISLWDIYREK